MGDVVPMEIEYSQGRVNPNVTEFAMNEDGYDLMHDADGGDDFYDSDGGSSTGGDDFFNVSSDSPDAYMPDNFGGSNSGEDFYASNGDEDYSNLTVWSKSKRKKFKKQLEKGASKLGTAVKQGLDVVKSIQGKDSPSKGVSAPPPPPPPPAPKGMSTGVKVAIGVGVVVVGVIAYYLLKKK
jgi:hypothetical protein